MTATHNPFDRRDAATVMTMRTHTNRPIDAIRRSLYALLLPVGLGAQVARVVRTTEPILTWSQTLSRIGLDDGITIAGIENQVDQYFRMPPQAAWRSGVLRVRLSYEFPQYRRVYLRLSLNDVPRRSISLLGAGDSTVIEIPLSREELAGRRVMKLSARLTSVLSDDRCYDQRIGNGWVRLEGKTGVYLRFSPNAIRTVATAWSALPETVSVDLPMKVTGGQLQAAWSLSSRLRSEGRVVRVTRSATLDTPLNVPGIAGYLISRPGRPTVGHIVIASSAPSTSTTAGLHVMSADSSIGLVLFDSLPAGGDVLASDLAAVLGASSIAVRDSLVRRTGRPEADDAVTLTQLGIGTVQRDVADRGEWTIPFSVRDMPGGYLPSSAALDMVGAPARNAIADVFNVYLNGVLVESMRLNMTGHPRRLVVPFPAHLVNAENRLMVQLQRESQGGSCETAPEMFPVQMLETSFIQGKPISSATDFSHIGPLLKSGFTVYVAQSIVDDSTAGIPLLAALGQTILPLAELRAVRFIRPGEAVAPTGPFVIIGAADVKDMTAPIRLDAGRVQVTDVSGRRLFELAGLTSTVVQIVGANGEQGLWIQPLGSGLAQPTLARLDRGNVAFIGNGGVDLAFNTDRDRIVRVTYPDETRWSDIVLRYRYWILALALAGATWGFVILMKQLYRRRANEQ